MLYRPSVRRVGWFGDNTGFSVHVLPFFFVLSLFSDVLTVRRCLGSAGSGGAFEFLSFRSIAVSTIEFYPLALLLFARL